MKQQTCAVISRVLTAAAIVVTLAMGAWAQTETILHTFTNGSDGGSPYAGLAIDSKGNLYGTAQLGGSASAGAVFEISPSSNGTWTENVIYNFTGFQGTGDGAYPTGGVTFDSKGNLYGTTAFGGLYGQGSVYELSPGSNGTWTEKVLYSFTGGSEGGGMFLAEGLVIDPSGNIYGAALGGGAYGFGVVFQLTPGSDGTWTETLLHTFTGQNDGEFPYGRLLMDAQGHLYGTAAGGPHDYGVLYGLAPGSNGVWTEKNIYAFTGIGGLQWPISGLASDQAGNLYVAEYFALEKFTRNSNGTFTPTSVHQFTGGSDGADAESGLIFDKAGRIYGTTYSGGAHFGTVYQATPNANGSWTERVLHKFTGGSDGQNPSFGALVMDASGNLYGATSGGGASGYGVVFQVKP